MKKLYLLVLLAVSMSFALPAYEEQRAYIQNIKGYSINGGTGYHLGFKFFNWLNGKKFYYYFYASATKNIYLTANNTNETRLGKPVCAVENVSGHLRRVACSFVGNGGVGMNLSYTDGSLWDGDELGKNFRERPFCADGGWWNGEEYEAYGDCDLGRFVIVNTKGKLDYGAFPKYSKRVGVLKNGSKCDEEISIYLDTEDSNNKNDVSGDDGNPPGISVSEKGVEFRYCVINDTNMYKVPYDYAVLKLSASCPDGTSEIVRRHDSEDYNNKNKYSGNIWPNEVKSNAVLSYCFVPADGNSKRKYPFKDKKYGAFANPKRVSDVSHYVVHLDDEDSNNGDYWIPKKLPSNVKKVMDGDGNTDYHVIKWVGSNSLLSKAAYDEVKNTYVAAAPFAPAIKGLNRSIVSVELKSAGDVKVSIVGVNGAVLANVAEKNLQPGDHQIKWNSGMVPSGRYIVKIEQNGMVNAKNVILK